jgi:hypothetical protein
MLEKCKLDDIPENIIEACDNKTDNDIISVELK